MLVVSVGSQAKGAVKVIGLAALSNEVQSRYGANAARLFCEH